MPRRWMPFLDSGFQVEDSEDDIFKLTNFNPRQTLLEQLSYLHTFSPIIIQ